MSDAPWQTTKRAGIACAACGHTGSCTVSSDRTAFKCWRDDGKVHQTNGNGHASGTGYVGAAHRKPPAVDAKPRKTFPAPEAAIEAAGRTTGGGTLTDVWTYRDADGEDVMRVARFNLPDGDKQFRPVHPDGDGWRIGDPAGPLPLYRLDELPATGTVWITEGEKAADAARGIGLAATTSAHGSSAAGKSDWTPLAGRDVVILPDHDEPGRKYARDVASIMVKLDPPCRVKVVDLPDLPDGGDVVEYIDARDSMESESIAAGIIALEDAAPVKQSAAMIGGPVLTCLADVESREVDWLMPGRVPLGRITLLVGKPGEGKSFLTTDMASRVTTGTPWPDGSDCPTGSVILISAEDDPGDTIRPRLDAHHADCRKVHLLSAVRRVGDDGKAHEVMFTLADVAALEAALQRLPDCKLIVVDPIGSFLGGGTDAHRDNEVRGVLAPVARLAEKYGPAVLVVAHRRKSAGTSADDLALGSRAFTGIARAVWHLSRDAENKHRRLLLPGKNNLAPEGDGLAFTICGEPACIAWEREPVRMSADDALAAENGEGDEKPGRPAEERDDAASWLAAELDDLAEHPVADLKRDATDAGIAWRTVQRAAVVLKVLRERSGFGGAFVWRLPKPGTPAPDEAPLNRATIRATTPESATSGTYGTIGELSRNRGFPGGTNERESHTCQNDLLGTNGADADPGWPDGRERGER